MENFRKKSESIRKGDIFFVDIPFDKNASVQGECRPCIILQDYDDNGTSPDLLVLPLTSEQMRYIPTHILKNAGLEITSTAIAEKPITVSKEKLKDYIGRANAGLMNEIN